MSRLQQQGGRPRAEALADAFPRRRGKAYQEVAQAIREKVLAGELEVGMRLPPERELARAFGVSRVVLREAIRTLEHQGLLEVRKGAGGGTFVSDDLHKPLFASLENLLAGGAISLANLFELRLLLEPQAAELAVRRATPQGVAALRRVVERARQVQDDSRRLRQANLEFHLRLVELAGNPLLSALCETVIGIMVEALQGRPNLELSREVLGCHQQTLQAVLTGDAQRARRLTEDDLRRLWEGYRHMGVELGQMGAGAAVGA